MTILMTAENPNGYKLEELAEQLTQEMYDKTDRLAACVDSKSGRDKEAHMEVYNVVSENNSVIITLLGIIKTTQLKSMSVLDSLRSEVQT